MGIIFEDWIRDILSFVLIIKSFLSKLIIRLSSCSILDSCYQSLDGFLL